MGKQRSLCWAIVLLVFTCLIYVYPAIYLVNAQPQPVYYPIANLSTSWINTPSSSGDYYLDSFVLNPILLRESIGNLALVVASTAIILTLPASFLWWSTQISMKTVSRTYNYLVDADGTFRVTFVLFDQNNATVWQSFDHPTDTLLLGQMLVPGQKLTASTSESNWSQGLYSLAIHGDGLFAYVESNPPQSYYKSYLGGNQYVKFENGSFNWNQVAPANTTQFMRFEPDGNLKVYEWSESEWGVVADLQTSGIGACAHPTVCGKYGICSNGQCSCLDETNNNETITFRQTIYRQPNLGCSLVTPISCNHSHYHTLLELKNTSYFNVYSQYTFGYLDEKTELEDCKKSCLTNCSCRAALFAYNWGYDSKRGCLLLSEVFSLTNTEDGFDNITIFLKVQKSSPPNSPLKKPRHVTIILGSSLGAFFGIFFMVASCLFLFKNKGEFEELDEFSVDQVSGMPTRFSYEDLKAMTSNFNNKLGEGGFGSVFQGTLGDGTKAAVKRLHGFCQVKKSFLAEVQTIGSIHHVNLVRLIGFCAQKSYRLLVYEYMSNGSLDKWIFQRHQKLTLGWQSRRKIIMDIAKGLAYLHEECRQKIIHLDIKPQNILLDEYFNAKISDFGLSKLIDKDQSQVVTTMRGTPGYLAPEWLSSIITEKADVYSFGVVILEILCGRKNLDRSQSEDDMHLLSLFKRKAEEERLIDIVDKDNEEMQLHGAEVVEMMTVAVCCLQSDFSRRPSMSMVVKVLEGSVDVENNLDYTFFNPVIPRTSVAACHQEGVGAASTLLFPSVLSGPR
ncbi:unnamed protein product [Camellia sinensis]